MKYLVIVLMIFGNYNLYGQKEDTLKVFNNIEKRSYNISIFGGGLIDNNFDKPTFGISYIKSYNKYNMAHLFELWTYKFQNNYFTTISSALRYNILNIEYLKFYIQAGIRIGLISFGLYYVIGTSYEKFFVDLRVPKFGVYPTYLTIGVKL